MSGTCKNCHGSRIIPADEFSGEMVCRDCGRVAFRYFQYEVPREGICRKTYKRIFYFNERIKRWCCEEPKINWDLLLFIRYEASKPKWGGPNNINRRTIGRILKSVRLPIAFKEKHRSQKFLCTKLSKKRFLHKFYEKWKTICCYITGDETNIPEQDYVNAIRERFEACQIPYELYKHAENCDGRFKCEKKFDCWNNFLNYDWVFRKLMQLVELRYPQFRGNFELYKDEFPLISKKIRENKLMPMWKKICDYRGWPVIHDD
jgi:hypothetical protein